MRGSGLYAAAAVSLVACSGSRSDVPLVASIAFPSAAPAVASARRPETPAHLCAQLKREQMAAIDEVLVPPQDEPNDPIDAETTRNFMIAQATHCWPSKAGVWGTLLTWVTPPPWTGYQGVALQLTLVHLGVDGRRSSIVPPPDLHGGTHGERTNAYYSMVDSGGITSGSVFDFDGKLDEELVLTIAGKFHEGESWTDATVYSADSGSIVSYGPADAIHFTEAKDIDGDHRPDLMGGPYQVVLEGCCSGFSHDVAGPVLAFHSLADGSFSSRDEVALRVAREACPSPRRPVIAPGEAWDEMDLLRNVACARLWGRTAAEIKREIVLATPSGSDTCDQSTCADRTELAGVADKWAAIEPPLTIR